MENTADRIHRLLIKRGVKRHKVRSTLADLCGISYQAVKEWFDGSTRRISPDYVKVIAVHYNESFEYLMTGEYPSVDNQQPIVNTSGQVLSGTGVFSAMAGQNKIKMLPKLDTKQSQDLTEYLAGQIIFDAYEPVGNQMCSNNSFVFTVYDDSMYKDGDSKSLSPGEEVIVDREEPILPGDIVIAYLPDSGKSFPRIYKDLGEGKSCLVPVNSYYPETKDAEIIGVVISSIKKFRPRAKN